MEGEEIESVEVKEKQSADEENSDLQTINVKNIDEQNIDIQNADVQYTDVQITDAQNVDAQNADVSHEEKNEADVKPKAEGLEPFFEDVKEEITQQKMLTLKKLSSALGNMSIVLVTFFFVLFMAQLLAMLGAFAIGAVLALFLIILTIGTLGLIYLTGAMGIWWGYVKKIMDGGADFVNFLTKLYVVLPFAIGLSFAFSIASIILQYKCGPYKSKARIVVSIIFSVLGLLLLIMMLAGVLSHE